MLGAVGEADQYQQRRLGEPAELLEIRDIVTPRHVPP